MRSLSVPPMRESLPSVPLKVAIKCQGMDDFGGSETSKKGTKTANVESPPPSIGSALKTVDNPPALSRLADEDVASAQRRIVLQRADEMRRVRAAAVVVVP